MDIFDMFHDEKQADFFERLKSSTDFLADDLDRYCDVGNRTAYRIVNGDSPLKFSTARQLVARHPDRRVGDAVCDYLTSDMHRQWFSQSDLPGVEEDVSVGDMIVKIGQHVDTVHAHQADGVTTQDERDEQLRELSELCRMAHIARIKCENQKVTPRRKARPSNLQLAGSDK